MSEHQMTSCVSPARRLLARALLPILLGLVAASCGGGGDGGGGNKPPAPAQLTSITVVPKPLPIGPGIVRKVRATGNYSDGTSADITSTAQWSTSDSTKATVAAGSVTGVAVGSVTITATSGSVTGTTEVDVTTNTWTSVADMTMTRFRHSATRLASGKVLVVGGEQTSGCCTFAKLADVEIYDPELDKWITATSLHDPRAQHTATLLPNGKVLVAGGDATGKSVELYDPVGNLWTQLAPMNVSRSADLFNPELSTATLLQNGKVLVVGGDAGSFQNGTPITAETYDPATNTWTSAAAPATNPHRDPAVVLLTDGRVLVAGGWNAQTPEAEIYDPAADSWTPAARMASPRFAAPAALLPDGKVLVAGGYLVGTPDPLTPPDGQIYDPVANSWTMTASTDWGGARGVAVTLPDNRVLIAGGYGGFGNQLAEPLRHRFFDPATGNWTSAGPSHFGREEHTATLLLSGAVLVTGGQRFTCSCDQAGKSAELYW